MASLHTHRYAEVFVVQEGKLTFTVGNAIVRETSGHVVALVGTPHGFVNSGTCRAKHVDIYNSSRMVTEWLEG
jgi:quercetin dioxygenase-like cupin family protein